MVIINILAMPLPWGLEELSHYQEPMMGSMDDQVPTSVRSPSTNLTITWLGIEV